MADPVPQSPTPTQPDAPPATGYSVTSDAWKGAGLPETYLTKDGLDLQALGAQLTEAQTMKAQAEERAKAIPADGKYDFALKDFKAPEGLDVPKEVLESWSVSPGRQAVFAKIAKDRGMSQAEVTAAMNELAAADITEKMAAAKEANDAQLADDAKFLKDVGGKESLTTLQKALEANPLLAPIFNPETSRADLHKAAKALLAHLSGPNMSPTNGGTSNGAATPPKKSTAEVLYGLPN